MINKYYECHITIEAAPEDKEKIKSIVEQLKWKFSAIEGDIVLGNGVKYYATMHYNYRLSETEVLSILHGTADTIETWFKVVRRKVELVIYDDRSSKVKPCNGGCIECHLDDLKGN